MVRSMTGFGRERMVLNGRDILIEIKSVNHRYSELTVKVPRAYSYIEEPLKKLIHSSISRGKTELTVSITNEAACDTVVNVNLSIAQGYINALKEANNILGLMNDLSLSQIMNLPDVFNVSKAEDDEDGILNDVKQVAAAASEKFLSMRECEGMKLSADVCGRLSVIEKMVKRIEKRSPEITENYRNRLYARLSEILGDSSIDEQRILTEAAIFSEKTAVDEETVRLLSHISQFRDLIANENIIGRKLDFIVQEMNREANTIGSKAQSLDITKIVIDIKSEIEKIREQIQNIE